MSGFPTAGFTFPIFSLVYRIMHCTAIWDCSTQDTKLNCFVCVLICTAMPIFFTLLHAKYCMELHGTERHLHYQLHRTTNYTVYYSIHPTTLYTIVYTQLQFTLARTPSCPAVLVSTARVAAAAGGNWLNISLEKLTQYLTRETDKISHQGNWHNSSTGKLTQYITWETNILCQQGNQHNISKW